MPMPEDFEPLNYFDRIEDSPEMKRKQDRHYRADAVCKVADCKKRIARWERKYLWSHLISKHKVIIESQM